MKIEEMGREETGPGQKDQGIEKFERDSLTEIEEYWNKLREEALHRLNTELARILLAGRNDLKGKFSSIKEAVAASGGEEESQVANYLQTTGGDKMRGNIEKIKREMREALEKLKLVE